jgi:glucose/arabinose dehydrogenase/type 1 glutamine amidotransferase
MNVTGLPRAVAALGLLSLLPAGGPAADAPRPKKVVLVAGAPDAGHPAGTHEYAKSVRFLQYCLAHSPNLTGVTAEAHFNGWPRDDSTLAMADTIVLITSGADRREQDHPLLVADRLQQVGKQMKRGCGLVTIHWTVFLPNDKAGEQILDWVGGYFDYQSGPPPRRWLGDIQHVTAMVKPGTPDHPICRGIKPFEVREEFYYRLRFRPDDRRRKPILLAPIPGEKEEQVVAWAVERADGGRGFGFTGGHYFDNWKLDPFRKLVLNAIAWTAHADVPDGGVESSPPVGDAAWTPPPKPGKVAAWERETDADWVDGRLRQMDTGPVFNATAVYPSWAGKAMAFKATAIKVGAGVAAGVLFDRNQLRLAAGWTGGFLTHSDRRFGLLNTPTPAGPVSFTSSPAPGWAGPDGGWATSTPATAPLPRAWAKYKGLYLHGDRVALAYTVGGADVLDAPWAESGDGGMVFTRAVEVGPSPKPLTMLACDLPAEATLQTSETGVPVAAVRTGDTWTAVALVAETCDAALSLVNKTRAVVAVPAADRPRRFTLLLWRGTDLPAFVRRAKAGPPPADLPALTKPGPSRWTQPVVTHGSVAGNTAPFVADTLTVPFDNPYRALMFLSGVDFLPNGDLAVCTAHGDVWLVRGVDEKLDRLTWKRFATGLYQPLGLKVVDGKIHVLERGQLTRLHDFDGDGEADFYENVNNDWHTGAGEHSYDTCLETDPAGNFYFFKTGDPHTPTGGCLLRVTKDGSAAEVFATGFRHPIGLSVSPEATVTGADQEGNWMPATRIDVYRRGGFYGDMRAHHRPTPPATYDPPLLWLPREADNSAGGQVWVPPGRFGPLAGQLLHLSYGRCKLFALLPQEVNGQQQAGAVDLGLEFESGVMRGRFRPHDGYLYVAGLRGWQTTARQDGCLQRVRYTGQPLGRPVGLAVYGDGVRLTFAEPLDRAATADPARYHVEQWNYRWTEEYGSKHWSIERPDREGVDEVVVEATEVAADGRGVFLRLKGGVRPVMQMKVSYRLASAAGAAVSGAVYNTVHATAR